MQRLTVKLASWLRQSFVSHLGGHFRKETRRRRCAANSRIEHLESREVLTVTFHGGALLSHVETQAVYLGSDWNTNSSLSSQTATLDHFLSYLVQSPYMDMLTNAGYNVGRGTADAGKIDNLTLNKTTGVTDTQIHSELQSLISSSQLKTPDANRLYVVFVESGVVVKNPPDASNTTFLGYHGAFAGRDASGKSADIRYVVIPYPGSPNFSATSQGFASNLDEITSVTSHELSEAVTDPNVNYKTLGWYDDQLNGEIGDLTSKSVVLNGYLVQDVVDKNDRVISPNTTVTPPSNPAPLSAPQNVAVTATSSTTATISWSSVSGTQGYRIYLQSGSQAVLLGSVGASATSASVTGLKSGTTVSFRVEAYSGTTVADSVWVSVAMPAQATLTAPQVTATALSSSSVRLSWGSVAGADGYDIYWWNGFQAVYLGTAGASATSIRVTGLAAGTTNSFLLEAFNSTSVADSNWVDVTTPTRRFLSRTRPSLFS